MIRHEVDHWVAYIFRRPDGMFMREENSGGMERAKWSEWTDDPFKATRYCDEAGLDYDHRWEDMLQDAKPVRITGSTAYTVEIPE